MIVEIIRLEDSLEHGTFGVLKIDKELFCYTLERPWLMNRTNASCIPVGQYFCSRYVSRRHGLTFEIIDVQDRLSILFHAGNVKDDTHGCVLLGAKLGNFNGKKAIMESKNTMKSFMRRMGTTGQFHLTIKNDF